MVFNNGEQQGQLNEKKNVVQRKSNKSQISMNEIVTKLVTQRHPNTTDDIWFATRHLPFGEYLLVRLLVVVQQCSNRSNIIIIMVCVCIYVRNDD